MKLSMPFDQQTPVRREILTGGGMRAIEQHHRCDVARTEVIVEEPPQLRASRRRRWPRDAIDHDQVDAAVAFVGDDVGSRQGPAASCSMGMSTASNVVIGCGFPFSVSSKSSTVSPRTGLPSSSVTTAST